MRQIAFRDVFPAAFNYLMLLGITETGFWHAACFGISIEEHLPESARFFATGDRRQEKEVLVSTRRQSEDLMSECPVLSHSVFHISVFNLL